MLLTVAATERTTVGRRGDLLYHAMIHLPVDTKRYRHNRLDLVRSPERSILPRRHRRAKHRDQLRKLRGTGGAFEAPRTAIAASRMSTVVRFTMTASR